MTEQELKNKIHENECFLLGQIPLDKEEVDSIMSYAKNIICLDDKSIIEGPDLRLSVALVLVAITDYQDGKYWEILKNKFDLPYLSVQKQGILGRIFLSTLAEYNLFELNKSNNGAMRYVENIKAHCFVTNNYMFGFYDFLYDYYENNLFRDISNESNEVEDTLQDLSDYIKTTMNQNDDIIYSDSTNNGKTKKSYRLLKSTREVIAECDGNMLYQLFYPSLKIIDDNLYDGILPEDNHGRFAQIFIEWHTKREEKSETKVKFINERKLHSRKPYLMLNTNKYVISPFTLILPKRRYRPTECDGKVKVTITINGIARPAKYLEVSTNMGTYISEEYRYQIGYPFDDIKVDIESLENTETIIKAKDYAIFNNDFMKSSRLEKGINYLLVKPNVSVEFSDADMLIDTEEFEEWTQYKLNITEESICYINKKALTIIGEFSKEPIFESKVNSFSTYTDSNKMITASRMHPLISLELDKNKLQGAILQINNRNYSLKNNEHIVIYNSPINKNNLIISVNINDLVDLTNNYYRIELNTLGEGNKFITEYLLLKNVNFLFDRARYTNQTEAKMTLRTNGMNIKLLDDECNLVYSNEFRNSYYYKFNLNSNYTHISAELEIDNKIFYIKAPIRMVLYGFSKETLMYGTPSEIWYSKLNELLYIKLPGATKLGIYSGKNLDNVVWGEEIEPEFFRINISSKIEEIKTNLKHLNYLNIRYIDNKDRWLSLFTVSSSIKIEPYFEFEYHDKQPCFKVEFKEVSGVKIFYSIEKFNTKERIITHRELLNGVNYLPEIERDVYYDIIPSIEETDEFGFNTKQITLPKRTHTGIISYKKHSLLNVNSRITINNILLNDHILELNRFYKYRIEVTSQISNTNEYLGKLYEYKYKYHSTNNNQVLLNEEGRRLLGNVKIKNIQKLNEKEIFFNLSNYSSNYNNWYNLFYIKHHRKIVEIDNYLLDSLKTSEVIELDCDEAKFVVKN